MRSYRVKYNRLSPHNGFTRKLAEEYNIDLKLVRRRDKRYETVRYRNYYVYILCRFKEFYFRKYNEIPYHLTWVERHIGLDHSTISIVYNKWIPILLETKWDKELVDLIDNVNKKYPL